MASRRRQQPAVNHLALKSAVVGGELLALLL